MNKTASNKYIKYLSYFLLIMPLFYYVFLSIQSTQSGESILNLLKMNPGLNINLIFMFLLFFWGYILNNSARNHNAEDTKYFSSQLLLILILNLFIMGFFSLAFSVMILLYLFNKQNNIKLNELFDFKKIKNRFKGEMLGSLIIILLSIILKIIVLTRL